MEFGSLNWIVIVLTTCTSAFIGSMWFGPKTFFPVWWRAMGRDESEKPGGDNMGLVFGLTFAGQLVQVVAVAVVLGILEKANGSVSLMDGLTVGLLLGFGVAAAASLPHRMFAGHGVKVWLLEAGNDIVAITVAAMILASWR